jgi:hypothetical protein
LQLLYSEALVSHEELEAFWGDGRMPPAPLGALSRGGGGVEASFRRWGRRVTSTPRCTENTKTSPRIGGCSYFVFYKSPKLSFV